MKPLLHEKLLADEALCNGYITTNSRMRVTALTRSEMQALADEIEKYYIPLPRFENGEPCNIGDEYIDHNGHNQTVSSLTYTKGGHDYVNINGWTRQRLDEPVKRPAPKVLDADGVEINPPCKAWDKDSCVEYMVESIKKGGLVGVERKGYRHTRLASTLTQREPDSLEKLHRDMSVSIKGVRGQHWECDRHIKLAAVEKWADRLTALMERDNYE